MTDLLVGNADPTDASGSGNGPQFDAVAEVYDVLMADVPYAMWHRYLMSLWWIHSSEDSPPAKVLDVACGTGTMAFRFEEDGAAVCGVDVSAAMVRVARRRADERGSQCRFLVQDACEMNLDGEGFDLAYSVFDSMNYITDPARLQQAFRNVRRALRVGGLFVFDVNTTYALRNALFDQQDLRPHSPVRYRWRSEFSESTRLCTVRMEFWVPSSSGATKSFVEVHVQRAYELEELMDMLERAGFADISMYHAYTYDPCTEKTDRAFYVAKAKTCK